MQGRLQLVEKYVEGFLFTGFQRRKSGWSVTAPEGNTIIITHNTWAQKKGRAYLICQSYCIYLL